MGLEEALEYVLFDPMGIFWKGHNRGETDTSPLSGGKLKLLASLGKLFGAGR
jgi:hypothetical protein